MSPPGNQGNQVSKGKQPSAPWRVHPGLSWLRDILGLCGLEGVPTLSSQWTSSGQMLSKPGAGVTTLAACEGTRRWGMTHTGMSKPGKWARVDPRKKAPGDRWAVATITLTEPVGQAMARSVTASSMGQGTETRLQRHPKGGAVHSASRFPVTMHGASQAVVGPLSTLTRAQQPS